MSKIHIKQLIEERLPENGMLETGVNGVQLFRYTEPLRCAPAVYEPCVMAIISGEKEAILDGESYLYNSERYMCCPISMPVEAGIRSASPETPLMGVYISLDTKVMTSLSIELEKFAPAIGQTRNADVPKSFQLSPWDNRFTEALLRLLQLGASQEDTALLGDGRLRELYLAVLKGEAGEAARRAFGVGNEIARSIEYLSNHLSETITIEDMAAQVNMSRAVFHRKFKQATTLSPIQFAKAMRLNSAAMKIAEGMNVGQAALELGYVSSSQFSREFKRMYGQTPKQWGLNNLH